MIGFLKSKITQNDRVARGHPITHRYVTRNYSLVTISICSPTFNATKIQSVSDSKVGDFGFNCVSFGGVAT